MTDLADNQYVRLVVTQVSDEGGSVKSFRLADRDRWPLPPFTPGAHIGIRIPGAGIRRYSLIGDPQEPHEYRIAVKRVASGTGGSRYLHEDIRTGSELSTTLVANHFPLRPSSAPDIFVAGGIGITPFLAMMRQARRDGRGFRLHYCARSLDDAPFLDEIWSTSSPAAPVFLHFSVGESASRLEVDSLAPHIGPHTHVYCCGPLSLIEAMVRSHGPALGDRLHIESFGPPAPAPRLPGAERVEVTLAQRRRTLLLDAGQPIAQGLRDHGIEVPTACEAGFCRTCELVYLAGQPVHRDLVLSAEQRGHRLLSCVTLPGTYPITLDL